MRGIIYYADPDYFDVVAAETDFSMAIKFSPDSYFIYLLRGGLYYWLQKDEDALVDFNRAVDLQPEVAESYIARAALHFRSGNMVRALKDYLKVLDLEPDNYGAMKRSGDALVRLGRTDEAEEVYRGFMALYFAGNDPFLAKQPAASSIEIPKARQAEVLLAFPECDELYFEWCKPYFAKRDFEGAWKLANRGVELNPKNVDGLSYRGLLHELLGQHDEAMLDFETAIRLNPVYAIPYFSRASAYNMQGMFGKAVEDYSKAIDLCGEVAFFYNHRADAYASLENYEDALADHAKAIELSGGELRYRKDRSFLYEKLGKYDLAVEFYNHGIKANPDGYAYYSGRAAFFERTGDYEKALKDYSVSIEKGLAAGFEPAKLKSLYADRADIYLEMGETEKALQDATTAIDLSEGKDNFAFMRRGKIYENQKQYELALGDYDRAVAIDPDDEYAHYYRAQALYNLLRYEDALEEYDLVIDNEMMPDGYGWLALRCRAEVLVQLGQYEQAIEDFDTVLIEHPTKQDVIDRRKVIVDFSGIRESEVPGLLLQ
jgi:tetratricopeptide (TPR) repeat protein